MSHPAAPGPAQYYQITIYPPSGEMTMLRSLRLWSITCCLMLSPALAPAQGEDASLLLPMFASIELDSDRNQPITLAGAIDEQHARWSGRVVELGRRLDRFFGGDLYQRESKTSELRLGLTTRFTHDSIDFDTRVRFRLALPNTERRLSIVLESAEEDLFDRGQEEPPGFAPRPLEAEQDYFAGLRYIRQWADRWGIDSDLGIKLRFPPEPYARVRGGRSWFIELWEARLSQSLFWRRSQGAGATTELVLQRALEGPQFFQAVTSATWLDRDQRFYYNQSATFSHEFSPLHAIQLRLGVSAESEPDTRITSYFMQLPWRRNIYRKWLFLEVRPELLFEEASDFTVQPRLFFVLEAYFGEKHAVEQLERPQPEPVPQPPMEERVPEATAGVPSGAGAG